MLCSCDINLFEYCVTVFVLHVFMLFLSWLNGIIVDLNCKKYGKDSFIYITEYNTNCRFYYIILIVHIIIQIFLIINQLLCQNNYCNWYVLIIIERNVETVIFNKNWKAFFDNSV